MQGTRGHPTAYGDLFSICEGWTSDELAQIHRISIALSALALDFEFGGGITDEGEQWCAFIRPDGEVTVHIACIDQVYRIYAPEICAPLSGSSLPEVTCRLLRAMARTRSH